MADAQPDFISQLRALNPDAGLDQYDDQTLASLVADQHPDYKPRLAKYLHPTADIASKEISQEGTQGIQGATPGGMTLGQALQTPSGPLMKAAGSIENPYLRGAAQFGVSQMTPANAAMIPALGSLPSVAGRAAAGAFGVTAGKQVLDSIPELKRLWDRGDPESMDQLKAKATQAGLTSVLALAGTAGAAGVLSPAEPKMVPDEAATAAAKTAGKAAEAVKDIPGASEAAEAQKAAQEAAAEQSQVPDQMRPEEPEETEGPPIVKGTKPVQTSSGPVQPNPPAIDEVRDELRDTLKAKGVDPDDPQAQANLYAKWYGLSKPINIASVGDVPVSESSDAGTHYDFDLAKNDPTMVAHELQHARQNEGQIPEVPEGPGANDLISRQVSGDLLPKYAANVNLNRLDIPENAKRAIFDYADQIKQTGPIPYEQTIADASAIGMNLDDAQKLAASTGDLHAQATAARGITAAAADQFGQIRQAYLQNPTDPGLQAGARHGLTQLISTMQASSEVAANIGRALSSYNIGGEEAPTLENQFGELLTQLQKKGKLSQPLQDKIIATNLEDPVQQASLRTALQSKNATLMDKISYYYVNSILSGVPTQMKKLSSDVGLALLSPIERAAAGKPGSGAARLYGTFSGLDDAFQALTRSWKEGSPDYQPVVPIGGTAGKVIGTPVRTLGAITDFVRQMNVRGSLYEQGYEAARAEGANPLEAMKQAGGVAEAPTPEQLSAAQADAKERVLLSKPGDFGGALGALRASSPFGKIIGPVLQLPINSAKYGTELSPLGLAKIAKLAMSGQDIPDATLGRAVVGSALWAYTAYLVNANKMTGEGPLDPAEFRRLYNTGWRPNSLLLDGKYIPLGWFGPIGFSMGMAATLAESLREAPNAVDAAQAATTMGGHFGRFILNQPYMQGLNNLVEMLHDPGTTWRLLGQTAGGFVPSLAARGAAAMDPYDRQLRTFVDMVRSRVPFLREEVPPKRDIEGDPLPAPGTPVGRFTSPMAVSEAKPLGLAQRVAADTNIGQNPGSVTFYGKKLALDEQDRDTYDQLVGATVKKVFDRINAAPSNFPTDGEAQKDAIKDIVKGAREKGAAEMIKQLVERGTLQAYVAAATGKQQAKMASNPYTDILNAPGAEKAEDTLDRYHIPRQGMPSSIPTDLAPEFQRELQKATGMYLYPAYADPAKFHQENQSFGGAQSKVQQLYDIATKHAAEEVLRQSGVKSQPEAGQ